ncbi:SRPBCC family protein [Nocardioides sp.]|uniref:SRPBCC family protein n=1 Tax=Nocardioides sp. TaxID=35761 RepID=UPI002ED11D2B
MSTPIPTGRREERSGTQFIVMERRFEAPIDAVWAAITEPDRLSRWIGTWTGDPQTGSVDFKMLYEGEGATPEVFTIDACDPPTRLELTSTAPFDGKNPVEWHLQLDLAEDDGVTTLTFAQSVPDPAMAESVGPGWEYYLDRLVTSETGGDVAAVDFDDYYPSQSGHYRAEFS